MSFTRRRFAPLLLALALLPAGCGPGERTGLAPDVKRELGRGAAYAQRLAAAGHAGIPDDQSTLALGYLERLRLGLGSPFRLADYALHDPRLGDAVRRPLAWAILERTVAGQDYRIDPAALDGVGVSAAGYQRGAGRYHLALIEGAVAEAGDPRAGELAVRLAYSLAAAEGNVWRRSSGVVAQAAALARDRALARTDALRLLRAAAAQHLDALELLVRWRDERRFLVEAPRLAPLPLGVESEALDLAPRLAEAVRVLRPQVEGDTSAHPALARSLPLLGPAAARHLLELADSADAPPETPVALALGIHRAELLTPDVPEGERRRRERMIATADDEEHFAAELALAVDRAGAADPALAATSLGAAAALRSYAQEDVWFPGFSGPSTRELEQRFGVTVSFDRNVPPEWRPYYRRMLAQALADLQRVLPAPDFRGLRVRFGRDPLGSQALALHDPERRILYLPPATSAGTIAHELAHDLDWQVAERRYGVEGDYATDLAARASTRRGRPSDPLSYSVSGLAGAALAPGGRGLPPSHQHRPAEVFARNVEWFVAAALAQQGIMDGYLSSVQDELLTGYGSVLPPDLTGGSGRALMQILDEVAPVYPETREWYLRTYGPGRLLSPLELLRRVLEPPGPGDAAPPGSGVVATTAGADSARAAAGNGYPSRAELGLQAVQRARESGLAAIDSWACAVPGAMYDRELEARRRQLVALGASARARGIALRAAGRVAGREGWLWMERRLYGAGPEAPLDSTTAKALQPVVDGARAVDTAGVARPADPFVLSRPADRCTGVLAGTTRLR